MRDPRPARVVLPVALFPVPPWCNPRSFRVNFRALYNYLRTTGTRLRSQYTCGFRLRNHFGRSLSVSSRSNMVPRADLSWTASGSWKTRGIHVESADLMITLYGNAENRLILRWISHFYAYFFSAFKYTNFTLISTLLAHSSSSHQSSSSGLATPGRATKADMALYNRARPSAPQPWSKYSLDACAGSFKVASACGDGYAQWWARYPMMMMALVGHDSMAYGI